MYWIRTDPNFNLLFQKIIGRCSPLLICNWHTPILIYSICENQKSADDITHASVWVMLVLVLNHPQKITDFHKVSGLFSDTDIYSGEILLNFIKSIFLMLWLPVTKFYSSQLYWGNRRNCNDWYLRTGQITPKASVWLYKMFSEFGWNATFTGKGHIWGNMIVKL